MFSFNIYLNDSKSTVNKHLLLLAVFLKQLSRMLFIFFFFFFFLTLCPVVVVCLAWNGSHLKKYNSFDDGFEQEFFLIY